MSKALRVWDYLGHILKAIERIQRYTSDLGQTRFLDSELVQDAVIRNIEIIGEASNQILRAAPEFAAQHDHIPWLVMYTMRNRVSHGYDKVDLEIVWNTIQLDLPRLHPEILKLQASAGDAASHVIPPITGPEGQRIGVAQGLFDVPDTIDANQDEVARLFTDGKSQQ